MNRVDSKMLNDIITVIKECDKFKCSGVIITPEGKCVMVNGLEQNKRTMILTTLRYKYEDSIMSNFGNILFGIENVKRISKMKKSQLGEFKISDNNIFVESDEGDIEIAYGVGDTFELEKFSILRNEVFDEYEINDEEFGLLFENLNMTFRVGKEDAILCKKTIDNIKKDSAIKLRAMDDIDSEETFILVIIVKNSELTVSYSIFKGLRL